MATNATETAKQENGSRVFFESVIEKGREPSDSEMFKIYDGYNSEWKETYRKQVSALKSFIKSNKGYEYSRDTGIMPYIENLAKQMGGVSVKDRWNPMDIVMVKKNKKNVIMGTLKKIDKYRWYVQGSKFITAQYIHERSTTRKNTYRCIFESNRKN